MSKIGYLDGKIFQDIRKTVKDILWRLNVCLLRGEAEATCT